jgi:lipopolysaccharide transport system permease protein
LSAAVEAGFELRGEATPLRALVGQIWRSRDLLITLARKDFFVRYRRASFGTAWAIALPIVQAAILAVVFQKVARIQTPVNYTTFVFTGLLPWSFFSLSLPFAATAIVDGQGLATKIYFPRAILPLASVAGNVIAFLPSVIVVLVVALIFGVGLSWSAFLLIPATLLMIVLTAGFGLCFAATYVYFRDAKYILQAGLLAWFWGSAVFFPLSMAGSGWLRRLIEANPVTGLIELFRAAIVGGDPGWLVALWWTLAWTTALLVAAAILYRRFDRVFVDLL